MCLDPEDDAAESRPGAGEWGRSLDMCIQFSTGSLSPELNCKPRCITPSGPDFCPNHSSATGMGCTLLRTSGHQKKTVKPGPQESSSEDRARRDEEMAIEGSHLPGELEY